MITDIAGEGKTFVASKRPPSPTSTIVASAGLSAKAKNAAAVNISKNVIWRPAFTRSQCSRIERKASSVIGASFRRTLSVKRTKWGDVYTLTEYPASFNKARRKAQVEPFPLVPAT